MRNLNFHSAVSLLMNPITWLSSNEEFESSWKNFCRKIWTGLIIFQWGIWMCLLFQSILSVLQLDYLPMRNLNYYTFNLFIRLICLIIFQWGIWMNSSSFSISSSISLIIFQWGIWICSFAHTGCPAAPLIIFQWGIWISKKLPFVDVQVLLDYLPMRNLNWPLFVSLFYSRSLIIFQWGIWILSECCLKFSVSYTWLSSNEEFESENRMKILQNRMPWLSSNEEFEFAILIIEITTGSNLIIFQWGIWI